MSTRLWHPCDFPERPTDPFVVWHRVGCKGCAITAEATRRLCPDDDLVRRILGPIAEQRFEAA